eukprot:5586569-Amphidinium_carterae.1
MGAVLSAPIGSVHCVVGDQVCSYFFLEVSCGSVLWRACLCKYHSFVASGPQCKVWQSVRDYAAVVKNARWRGKQGILPGRSRKFSNLACQRQHSRRADKPGAALMRSWNSPKH